MLYRKDLVRNKSLKAGGLKPAFCLNIILGLLSRPSDLSSIMYVHTSCPLRYLFYPSQTSFLKICLITHVAIFDREFDCHNTSFAHNTRDDYLLRNDIVVVKYLDIIMV